jgi:site-specific DNA recombinase
VPIQTSKSLSFAPGSPIVKLTIKEKFEKIRERQNEKDLANRAKITNLSDGTGHAVGYTRVSTIMQVEDGKSLPAQKRTIEDYCLRNNLKLEHIYTDGKSGGDHDRTDFNKMISDLLPGMKIVVISSDRFARSIEHVIQFKNRIHAQKCSIVIIDAGLDTANPISDMVFSVLSCFSELERRNTKAKISAVMQDMSREGTLKGKPKYGWKVVEKNKIIEDPDEQLVIGTIRDMIIDDPKITLTAIVNQLTDAKIIIRKCSKIYPTTIKNIIRDNNLRPV